jgi:hypothetical protein
VSLRNSPVGLLLHAPQTQHPGAYPPCPIGIPAGLREGGGEGGCEGGCEGEGEKFLMGIMTACHADPGPHPCVLAGDARSSFAPSAAKPAIEGSGAICDGPIGTKESIRGPSASTVSWGLPETVRDCQRPPETSDRQKIMPANTETPPELREFPSVCLCCAFHCFVTHATQPQPPTQSSKTPTEHQNFHSFACANILESQRRRLLSRISPVAYSWSRRVVAVRICLSLPYHSLPSWVKTPRIQHSRTICITFGVKISISVPEACFLITITLF